MKKMCNIIRDILPLYAEGMANSDTVSFVDEHLGGCADCRAALDDLKTPSRVEEHASEIPENCTLPLKTFRKKWHRKKVILVCATIIATIAVICCVFFAAEHFVYQEKIAVNDAVYVQIDGVVADLPTGSMEIGYLRGISHRSTGNPMGNFMATNLDEKYGGSAIYQSGTNAQIIYLEDYNGFYIPFEFAELITPAESPLE